jgi:hypothetical protein
VGKSLVFFTLRSLAEVRPAADNFEDLAEQPAGPAQVTLAQQIIESKSGELDMAKCGLNGLRLCCPPHDDRLRRDPPGLPPSSR